MTEGMNYAVHSTDYGARRMYIDARDRATYRPRLRFEPRVIVGYLDATFFTSCLEISNHGTDLLRGYGVVSRKTRGW